MMTSDGNLNPPVAHKMVWGTLIAAITVGTIFTESVPVAKAMAIAGALPFSVILLVQIVGFLREIRKERRRPRPIEERGAAVGRAKVCKQRAEKRRVGKEVGMTGKDWGGTCKVKKKK